MNRFACLTLLLIPTVASAADVDLARLARIDDVMAASIKRNDCPGAVVLVVNGNDVVFRKAYGQRAKVPTAEAMTVDTVFDMASVTKPVTTATSVMILLERGLIRPSDKVSKYWPEFAANGKRDVTVEQCLLHTTGLTADNSINDYKEGRSRAVENVAKLPLEAPPGTRFRYSDVGFIVLGELVHRISGLPVNEFAAKEIFTPLKMTDSGFNPKAVDRIAPTGLRDKKTIRGTVHDPRSFAMDGVAGHAGLFGTADDLAIYCRMLLNGGEVNGVRILSPLTVRTFTQPHALPGGGSRSLGWDVDTSFSAQRGELFPAGEGFGHTGFTGTSVWVDPASNTAVILLTNRVHPDDKGNVTELRRQIGTIVASSVIGNWEFGIRNGEVNKNGIRNPQSAFRNVLPGIDVLKKDGFKALKGKKVGLVTNHTGKDREGNPTIDLIAKAEGVTLVSLFSPEHGIRGEKDEKVGDGKDEKTGLPIYSLYGERRKPTPEQLKGLDAIVYDIQDIGCRFYTYISTLKLVLQAGAEAGVPIYVLDRPNPLGGLNVEGPMLDPGRETFVGTHALPLRHGLTVGELATLFNADSKTPANLTVVKCEGWKRGDTFDVTNLPWRNPSPNMRHLTAAMLYPGIGILETTNISVGRGTERPFEWVGAPWIDGAKLAAAMAAHNLPGVRFVPCSRTPVASVHKDKACGGMDIVVTDWNAVEPVRTGLTLATTLRSIYPSEWETKRLDTLLIHKATFDGVVAGKGAGELERAWTAGLDRFRARRMGVLLYAE